MLLPLPLWRRGIPVSRLALAWMGVGGAWGHTSFDASHVREAHAAVGAALEVGIRLFDHADIYRRGKAKTVFGRVLAERPGVRDTIYVQSTSPSAASGPAQASASSTATTSPAATSSTALTQASGVGVSVSSASTSSSCTARTRLPIRPRSAAP
jgi:aryl-alcohol dehydrogenase-like predicted oxidoreductase